MISQKSSPGLGQVAVQIPPPSIHPLKASQSESRIGSLRSLKSLTRDMGLRLKVGNEEDGETDNRSSVISDDEPISPRSMISALDRIHVTHMDGVDILYNSISKELNVVREKIEQNNRQSTWRQIAGLITTIVISVLFNIFVFPKFSSAKCN